MKVLQLQALMLLGLVTLAFQSCIIIDDDIDDGIIIPRSTIEVNVTHSHDYQPLEGVEITLYETLEDAECYPHSIDVAKVFTDQYGVAVIEHLPVGRQFFIRAQHPFHFKISSVFIDRSGV